VCHDGCKTGFFLERSMDPNDDRGLSIAEEGGFILFGSGETSAEAVVVDVTGDTVFQPAAAAAYRIFAPPQFLNALRRSPRSSASGRKPSSFPMGATAASSFFVQRSSSFFVVDATFGGKARLTLM